MTLRSPSPSARTAGLPQHALRLSRRGHPASLFDVDFLPRALVTTGLLLVVLGVALYALPSLPMLGRLPGDIRIERPGFRFYLPITTCLLLSAALTGAFWLVSKLR